MAATAAERQRARRRRATADNKVALNVLVDLGTRHALARLAQHHGVTQSQVLERLVVEADRATSAMVGDRAYFGE
jgi:hypothetical protein